MALTNINISMKNLKKYGKDKPFFHREQHWQELKLLSKRLKVVAGFNAVKQFVWNDFPRAAAPFLYGMLFETFCSLKISISTDGNVAEMGGQIWSFVVMCIFWHLRHKFCVNWKINSPTIYRLLKSEETNKPGRICALKRTMNSLFGFFWWKEAKMFPSPISSTILRRWLIMNLYASQTEANAFSTFNS